MTEPAKTTFYDFSKKPLGKIAEGLQDMTVKIRLWYPLKEANRRVGVLFLFLF